MTCEFQLAGLLFKPRVYSDVLIVIVVMFVVGASRTIVDWRCLCYRYPCCYPYFIAVICSSQTMYNLQCTVMVVLLLCCLRMTSAYREDPSDGRCFLDCTAPEALLGEIYTHCHISEPLKLDGCSEEISHQLKNISHL